eukprot:8752595-Alexandrium_andersonii.AAC.1
MHSAAKRLDQMGRAVEPGQTPKRPRVAARPAEAKSTRSIPILGAHAASSLAGVGAPAQSSDADPVDASASGDSESESG